VCLNCHLPTPSCACLPAALQATATSMWGRGRTGSILSTASPGPPPNADTEATNAARQRPAGSGAAQPHHTRIRSGWQPTAAAPPTTGAGVLPFSGPSLSRERRWGAMGGRRTRRSSERELYSLAHRRRRTFWVAPIDLHHQKFRGRMGVWAWLFLPEMHDSPIDLHH
jgi:hypothetical protein